jgi:hypothetical protein
LLQTVTSSAVLKWANSIEPLIDASLPGGVNRSLAFGQSIGESSRSAMKNPASSNYSIGAVEFDFWFDFIVGQLIHL